MTGLPNGWEKLPSKKKNELINKLVEERDDYRRQAQELNVEVQKGLKLLKQEEKHIVYKREKILALIAHGGMTFEKACEVFDKANEPYDAWCDKNTK